MLVGSLSAVPQSNMTLAGSQSPSWAWWLLNSIGMTPQLVLVGVVAGLGRRDPQAQVPVEVGSATPCL